MIDISIIIPVYNEAQNITVFVKRMTNEVKKITNNYEIIFALDPSTDDTEEVILKEIEKNNKIKLMVFSRRFGQSAATMAALKNSKGERCLIIDCDLQDPPELLNEMYTKMDQGYDVVLAKRKSRKGETVIKKSVAAFGYNLINKISDVRIPINSGDFRLISKKIVNYLNEFDEPNAFLRGLVAYVGFKQTFIEYDREERFSGISKYNKYLGSIKIAFNGLFGFGSKPIFFMSLLGFVFAFLSFLIGIYYIIVKLVDPNITPGLSSTILIISFFSGLQLIALGILGEYIGRIYDEVKKRPKYIIDKKINFDE
ncbi:glycosyltransferase family 2 protein [Candidatus Pelagibacter sp.]|nr:glycosyltransferase family 2 protein [Candidatus Pelagibacter sp.]